MNRKWIVAIAMGGLLVADPGTWVSATAPRNLSPPIIPAGAVRLNVPPQPDGSDVSRIFSKWGIELSSESGPPPVSGTRTVIPYEHLPVDARAVLNGAIEVQAGALVVAFGSPVHVFGVALGAEHATDAAIRYFGTDGQLLGEEVQSLSYDYVWVAVALYVDVEERPISRVEIEYEDSEEPEALFSLWAEFVEPPVFRSCVAQIAHGAIPDTDRRLQTQLSMTNSAYPSTFFGAPDALVQLKLFDPSGEPSPVILDGQETSPAEFRLVGVGSKVVRTSGSGAELHRGYACATSKYPIEMAAVYRILDADGRPVSEAGIQASQPGYRFFGIFQKNQVEGTDTAVAIANISEHSAEISIKFNFPLPQPSSDATLVLQPGEQKARFLGELAPELADQDVEGTIEIVSDQEIVATILRTIDRVVSSSLPLGRSPASGIE